MFVRRTAVVATATVGMLAAGSGVAFAHQCINISKPTAAGVQIIIDETTGEPSWMTKGLEQRIANGLVDFETGEGFSGLLGIDFDGDGTADVATYLLGPTGEIPQNAQWNGAECKGIVNFEALFTCPTSPL